MSIPYKQTVAVFLRFFVVKVVFAAFHNETIEFSSNQEVFVGEDAYFKWSLDKNLATNIANVKFGVVTRPASHGERLDAILIRTLPSGKIKWNRQSSHVKAYVNRTEVIEDALAGFKIHNVQLNDTSEFYCTVRKTGESQTMITDYVKLKVIDIEILNETSSQDVISWEGHKIRLRCNIRIIPDTNKKFTWFNMGTGGTVVDPSKQRDAVNGSTLTIVTFKDTDFGPYKCDIRTPSTEQSHVIHIKRLYEPSKPGNFSHNRKLVKRINCTVVANVSWMPPLQHGGAPVTHYIVEYKPFGREWSKASRQKVDTNHIMICRPPRDEGGEGLSVRVKAKNKVGVGKPSLETIVTFWDVPTAPLNLKYRLRRDLGEPFVELYWEDPSHDGGVPVNIYRVEYKPQGGSWSAAAGLTTVEKQINFWKSSHDEDVYDVRVSAYNDVGPGEKSSILKVVFAEVPSMPLNVVERTVLHVKQPSPHIHITWRRPLDNGGKKITHYRVEYKIVSQDDWKLARSDLIVDEDYVIKDVDENREYEVRVSAKNKIGFGSWSRPVVLRYKGRTLVASKARSPGSRLTLVGGGALALVFLLVTLLIIPLPR